VWAEVLRIGRCPDGPRGTRGRSLTTSATSSPRLDPLGARAGQLIANIAGIQGGSRFEEDDVCLLQGYRAVFHHPGHSDHFARPDRYVAVAEFHAQTALYH